MKHTLLSSAEEIRHTGRAVVLDDLGPHLGESRQLTPAERKRAAQIRARHAARLAMRLEARR